MSGTGSPSNSETTDLAASFVLAWRSYGVIEANCLKFQESVEATLFDINGAF